MCWIAMKEKMNESKTKPKPNRNQIKPFYMVLIQPKKWCDYTIRSRHINFYASPLAIYSFMVTVLESFGHRQISVAIVITYATQESIFFRLIQKSLEMTAIQIYLWHEQWTELKFFLVFCWHYFLLSFCRVVGNKHFRYLPIYKPFLWVEFCQLTWLSDHHGWNVHYINFVFFYVLSFPKHDLNHAHQDLSDWHWHRMSVPHFGFSLIAQNSHTHIKCS